ncbi:DUF2508 family protein [Paenibacillus sp. YYML68]|uniref:DUF2508 family protein n=1 Tax=Paenibacillus sp. YYML68 TaxID=2909250 RepID=UPI00248F5C13|nr:DUF2508 family protein [Paenibacillus sp. YYML68]
MVQWRWQWWKESEQQVAARALREEHLLLIHEIRKAHMEWEVARSRFEYALEKEQVDYAVYALEAAEKRYEMLIRQAKVQRITTEEVCAGIAMEGSV